jgi:hypothetical protein
MGYVVKVENKLVAVEPATPAIVLVRNSSHLATNKYWRHAAGVDRVEAFAWRSNGDYLQPLALDADRKLVELYVSADHERLAQEPRPVIGTGTVADALLGSEVIVYVDELWRRALVISDGERWQPKDGVALNGAAPAAQVLDAKLLPGLKPVMNAWMQDSSMVFTMTTSGACWNLDGRLLPRFVGQRSTVGALFAAQIEQGVRWPIVTPSEAMLVNGAHNWVTRVLP